MRVEWCTVCACMCVWSSVVCVLCTRCMCVTALHAAYKRLQVVT